MTSTELITFHKSLLNKKCQEQDSHINPYASALFTTQWKQMSQHIFPSAIPKIKPQTNTVSLKNQIISWISATMVRGRQFILNFLKYSGRNYQKEDFNFSSGKCLKKIFQQEQKCQTLQKFIRKIRVGWFSEPVIYLKQTELNQNQMLPWLQQVTSHQIFEFANKINDKEEPEQNLLWFNSQSFQSLQAWLVNQFQKSIIKNFFSKKNNYTQLQNFKTYLQLNSPQQLIFSALTFNDLRLKTKQELQEIQNSMKIHEINYLQQLNNKIITSLQVLDIQKTKKKRNKKKLKKKSASNSPFVHTHVESPKKKHPQSESEMVQYQQKNDENQAYDQFQKQQKQDQQTQQISTIIVQVIQQKRDFEEDQDQDNKSSISHDRISPSKRNSKCRDRSLSPNAPKSTPNENCSGSLTSGKCYQTFTEDNKSKNEQFQLENFDEMKQDTNVAQKKRRRKKNKNQTNIVEDMANKATMGLINKQLTGLIDNLGIQTNELYQSKVLAFQRVVFFIKNICPQAEGLLFGSNAVGLSLPTSDIDIVLHNFLSYSRQFVNEFLAQVAIDINAMGWIVSCSTYLNAKIPLVKLQIDPSINYFQTKRKSDYQTFLHPMHFNLNLNPQRLNGVKVKNIQVDLSISMEQGFITCVQSTELMRIWMEIYPQLQRILIAFKYVLAQKGFNSNFKGGIGGYCLFVMISAYFKQFQKELPQNQGEIFLNILKFYGEDFQNKLKSITLRQTQSCFISLEQSLKFSDIQEEVISLNPLRIIDPLNQKLTSSSCHQYPIIKAEFRRIRKQLLDQYGNIQKQLTVNYNPNDISKIMATKKGVDKWINKYQSRSGLCIRKIINGTSIREYQ